MVAFHPIARRCFCLLLLLPLLGAAGCHFAAGGHNLDGVRLTNQGQYAAALQEFQQAVAVDPENADAYYNMGRCFHELGLQQDNQEQLATAEALYNQCLDWEADHVDGHRALAVLLVQTGRSDRAFNLLKNWAARSPNAADSRVELARLYEEFGDKETARIHLQEAIRIDQKTPRAWTALARLDEQNGDLRSAQTNYLRSYHLNNLQPQVAQRLAVIQRSMGAGIYATTPDGRRLVNSPGSVDLRY